MEDVWRTYERLVQRLRGVPETGADRMKVIHGEFTNRKDFMRDRFEGRFRAALHMQPWSTRSTHEFVGCKRITNGSKEAQIHAAVSSGTHGRREVETAQQTSGELLRVVQTTS